MSFFNIAINNVKKRFKSYLIYLVSTAFAVTIFNIFCTMYFNPQFSGYRYGTGKMSVLFKASAVAVILFSSVFVFYANKFFVKTRKKEIAIYSLLGMKKSQIGRLLFYENIFIGIVATGCGIIIGTVFSRFFSMILMRLMAAGTKVSFTISLGAIVTTVIAFLVLFLINSINAYVTIYRFKLIELLSASKEGEKVPNFSLFIGILSILVIAAGYVIAMRMDVNKGGLALLLPSFLILSLVVTGTLLFFKSFIPMAVIKLKNNKKLYYRTGNFISMSQIVYRIKANANILSIITLLTAAAVTLMSSTFSMYKGLEGMGKYYSPFSYMCKNIDDTTYNKIIKTIKDENEVKVTSSCMVKMLKVQGSNPIYSTDTVRTLGMVFDGYVISQSAYKSIIKSTKTEKGNFSNTRTSFNMNLDNNECYFIDGNINKNYCENLKGSTVKVSFLGKDYEYKVAGMSLHKYIGVFELHGKATLVVNDGIFNGLLSTASGTDIINVTGLMFDKPMKSQKTIDELNKIVPENNVIKDAMGLKNASHIGIYKFTFSLYGAYVFIGMFLGILFILATGSIIYYKQIIEAQEEVGRYDILCKTGMSKLEIKQSIAKQLAIIFGMPLLVGLMHSLFGIFTYNRTMDIASQETPTMVNALIIVAIYVIIYCFYYILSVNNYTRIVSNKR